MTFRGGDNVERFEIVKRARATLASMPESVANLKTTTGYRAKAKRLIHQVHANGVVANGIDQIIAQAKKTTSIATWFSRRAALIYSFRAGLSDALAKQDKLQRALRAELLAPTAPEWETWGALVDNIGMLEAWLLRVRDEPAPPPETRKPRHSKRRDMRGLPDDWRERIVARLPKYHTAALVAAVTGCRPDELVTGIRLSIEDGHLVALIRGSKQTEKTGQPWRRLFWPLDSSSSLVQAVIDLVNREGRVGEAEVRIKDAKAFSGAMRAAGHREWPGRRTTITPYCLRHQAAADMKASGQLTSEEIAAALGHCCDVTKTTYGHANMGRRGGTAPKKVVAARTVSAKLKNPVLKHFNQKSVAI